MGTVIPTLYEVRKTETNRGMRTQIEGSCHCGNIRFALETDILRSDVIARSCECSFCRKHGAKTFSDPNGSSEFLVRNEDKLQRYVFALGTADFFICKACGVYIGGVVSEDQASWSTLNLRLKDLSGVSSVARSYCGEDAKQRIARRKKDWTPTKLGSGHRLL